MTWCIRYLETRSWSRYFPPLSAHVTVSLFKPATKAERWDELIGDVLPEQAANELTAAVQRGATVMIVGPPDSGKKTLLNVLLGTLSAAEPVAVIDESRSLTAVRSSARVILPSGPSASPMPARHWWPKRYIVRRRGSCSRAFCRMNCRRSWRL